MNEDRPHFSRWALGKQRWFWVVYRLFSTLYRREDPCATRASRGSNALGIDATTQGFTAAGPRGQHPQGDR